MGEPAARIAYEFEQFHVDPVQRLLRSRVDGEPVTLTSKVFETLLYLVEHRGELVEKATLMKAIWPNVVVEENNLTQNISALRRALGETALEHRFIVTVPGRGYRFVAEVHTLTIPGRTSAQQQPAAEASTAPSTSQPKAPPSRSSIAVLPFANLTREPEKEYFSDGLAEELIHLLARVPGLRVPARTSSFAYKGRNVDIRQIASDLEVGVVLEGSVRSAGERIRVTAQLSSGKDGYQLWSQRYDRQFTDLFALQEDLATEIVQAVGAYMHIDLPSTVQRVGPTQDLQAYDLYLQARSLIGRPGAENLKTAGELLRRAIERDPQFAPAFSALGRSHLSLFLSSLSFDPQELDNAEGAARRALSLEPDLGEARALMAQVAAFRGNWIGAQRGFEAALALNIDEPTLHESYTTFLHNVGHVHRALTEAREADRLAPGLGSVSVQHGVVYSILGLDNEAVRYADKAINLGVSPDYRPLHVIYSHAAFRRGDMAEAGARMIKVLPAGVREAGGDDVVKLVYAALSDSSREADAINALQDLHPKTRELNSSHKMMLMMHWYTMLGARDLAYEIAYEGLNRLLRGGTVGGNVWAGLWIPEMRPFRQDQRFQEFADALHLTEYWQRYGAPDGCELRDGKLLCG
jgi:TolB-like protein/Tfp pilus assembly protein PilF